MIGILRTLRFILDAARSLCLKKSLTIAPGISERSILRSTKRVKFGLSDELAGAMRWTRHNLQTKSIGFSVKTSFAFGKAGLMTMPRGQIGRRACGVARLTASDNYVPTITFSRSKSPGNWVDAVEVRESSSPRRPNCRQRRTL